MTMSDTKGTPCISGGYTNMMANERMETHACDCISRQWLLECVNEGWIKFDTEKDENRFIHLVRDIAPSVQPVLTCDGCRFVGTYDTDFPCNGCVRREKDYYDPE